MKTYLKLNSMGKITVNNLKIHIRQKYIPVKMQLSHSLITTL